MQCRIASEIMSAGLDDQLSEEEIESLRRHLAGCARCSAEWSWVRRVDALFEGVALATPPPQLSAAIMARVQRRAAGMAMLRGGTVLVLGLVIILGMVFVPLAALSGPVTTVSDSPATVSALVGAIVRIAAIVVTLVQAVSLVLRAVIASPGIAALALYALGAAALALWWVRVVAGPGTVTFRKRTG